MIPVTATYKEIMDRPLRNRAFVDLRMYIINQDAQAEGQATGNFMWYAQPNTIWDDEQVSDIDYATLEQDYWRATGEMYFAPPQGTTGLAQNLITTNLLGSVTLSFTAAHDIRGLTINFGEYYPTKLRITSSTGEVFEYTNNSYLFIASDIFFGTESLLIEPLEMQNGQQRLRIKTVMFGYTMQLNNENTSQINFSSFVHGLSEEIPSMKITVDGLDYDSIYNVNDENSAINFFESGQKVTVKMGLMYDDDYTIEWLKMATLYMEKWVEDQYSMQFTALDLFAFLTGKYSDVNRIHTRTLYQEAVAVLTEAGVQDYWIDDCLKDITVTNPMPEASYAQCLQLIANAGRCILYQDAEGVINIRANFATSLDPEDITVTASGAAVYSIPHSVLEELDGLYADVTRDYWRADGTMYFVPPSAPYLKAGFISNEVADANGNFVSNPSITFDLGGGFIYHSIIVTFETNPPQEVVVHTYLNNQSVEDVTFTGFNKGINGLSHSFLRFDTFTLEFTKGCSYDRIYVSKVAVGALSDYTIRRFDMLSSLQSTKEERVSEIRVRVITFQDDGQGNPQMVDDDVWATITTDYQGYPVSFENQLISTQAHALLVAEWVGNYYQNNVSYDIDFRGDPRIEAGDIALLENEFIDNLQVQIEEVDLDFNGAFSGKLKARRAINKVDL